jgi:hypothetical protein
MITHIRAVRRMAVAAAAIAGATAITLAVAPAASSAPARPSAPAGAAAHTPKCTAADLGVWVAVDQMGAAAGTLYMPLEFTNLSGHACTLRGFPGVSAISKNGRELGSPATWDQAVRARTVRLAPAATGYALLEYSDVVTGNCPAASKGTAFELRVYPPDQGHADHALFDFTTCSAKGSSVFLRVRVIAPGIGVVGDSG